MRAGFICVFALVFPLVTAGLAAEPARANPGPQNISPPRGSSTLSDQGKLALVRYVDGEYAKVVQPLPSINEGFELQPGKAIDKKALDTALVRALPAANPGDTVQITSLEFHSKQIVVNINGGSHPSQSWRQRIHLSISSPMPTARVVQNQATGQVQRGSTLILDFQGPVPNLTPDQLKQYLAPFLNFAGQRSAAQTWVGSLSPQFQQAIQEHQAIVGMNRDMVIAALGLADHKVREFQTDGTQTEDWIYGSPPGRTIFVTFVGNQVVKVKQFP